MTYTNLFNQRPDKTVRAGVIGSGHFATAVVTQAQSMPRLDVPVVADIDVAAAQTAYQRAGIADDDIAVCESHQAATSALDKGKRIILQDAMLMMDLPLDVVVEATGVPEAGARHAKAAIDHGKHVAMVNKETDVTIGPILKYLADQAGVIYTPVDGDQHGLLIGLVGWARELGLEVLCGGKARDTEYVFDPDAMTVATRRHTIAIPSAKKRQLQQLSIANIANAVAARQTLLAELPSVGGFDLVEMAITSNATGLLPDVETLYCPALYTSEIPDVLCPINLGGILQRRNTIDAVTCLRQPHEAGLIGGVFLVVACDNDYSRHILLSKGLNPSQNGNTGVIFRPYHLCGVETPMSILNAALLGASTLSTYKPHVDAVVRAKTNLKAGDTLGDDHSPDLHVLIHPAQAIQDTAPLPIHMGNGHRLAVDVPAGTLITAEMVVPPMDSMLWALRKQQDKQFELAE